MYKLIIEETKNNNYKQILKLAGLFNIQQKLDITYYKNILEFYDNNNLIGFVNYCITPSMKGKDRLFIRNLYYVELKYLNDMVVTLCDYCKNKNLIIMTSIDDEEFTKECIDTFYNNNFKGNNIIMYTY